MIERTLTLRRAILVVVVSGLLLPALLISGYTWFERYDAEVQKRTQELVLQNADVLSKAMNDPLWNIDAENGRALIDAMMSHNEDIIKIEVRDASLGLFVQDERPERRAGYTASAEKTVNYRGSNIGSVRIEVGSTRLRRLLIESIAQQALALLAQIVFSIILILILLERRLVAPLQKLGKGAEDLASRKLDVPFTWTRLDEIGLLSQRLEATRLSLHTLFDELEQKNLTLEHDIETRKRIEHELHEREARFRALVEQSPIAIIEWDSSYRVIEWNAAAERIFGYTRQQAIGQHGGFINPAALTDTADTADATQPEPRSALHLDKNGAGHQIEENIRADGQIIVCQWSNADIDDESGHTGRVLSMAEDITEKRKAEEAQRLSEAKFAGAFQCNLDLISITRFSDGEFLDVNQTFEKTTGYARGDLTGKNAVDLGIWEYPEENDVLLGQLNMYKTVRDYSWSMRTRRGQVRQCLTNATIFTVGTELYMLAVIRDVTDQRAMEEQKAEADRALLRLAQGTQKIAGESFFELLVADLAAALRTDRAFLGMRVPQAPNRIRTIAAHANGRRAENFEYAIAGAPCEVVLEGDLCVYANRVQHAFPDDHSLAQNGWESYAGAPIRDVAGNSIGVLAVMHSQALGNPDLVRSLLQVFSERVSAELERKQADEALRNSQQRFSTIFQSSPVAMFLVQFSGKYVLKDVNSSFERLFLRKRDAVIGKNTAELGMYADEATRNMIIEDLNNADSEHRYEVWMTRGDGSQILAQISSQLFTLADERYSIVACEDVTDKRRIEREIMDLNVNLEHHVMERTVELQKTNKDLANALATLNVAQDELVRSEKLAALGSLVAGVAHELNTPIGNSLIVASTLADQTKILSKGLTEGQGLKRSVLDDYLRDAAKASDILERNLYRAANLVTSFKQVAVDQTSSQRRLFLLAEVISEIMLTLWPTLKKTAFSFVQNIPQDLELDSYPGPLGQVVTNLVNNALLHGFEGRTTGSVVLSANSDEEGWVELKVWDDGNGIPAANLNRIFDPFFTTKLGAGGSGLGLNITHNIVTGILGGRIRVQSELGVGTTFILNFPKVAPQLQVEDIPLRRVI